MCICKLNFSFWIVYSCCCKHVHACGVLTRRQEFVMNVWCTYRLRACAAFFKGSRESNLGLGDILPRSVDIVICCFYGSLSSSLTDPCLDAGNYGN